MRQVKITYDFTKLKGKPKRTVESIEGCTIKSYGVDRDSVTLIFFTYTEEAFNNAIDSLKKIGVKKITY